MESKDVPERVKIMKSKDVLECTVKAQPGVHMKCKDVPETGTNLSF